MNKILNGLVTLKRVFDGPDISNVKQSSAHKEDLEEISLGKNTTTKKLYIGRMMKPYVRTMLIALFQKYRHVFTWSYDDLKTYKEELFQYEITLKPDTKPFRKKQRPINPTLRPKMQEELTKLSDARIIKQLRHSSWMSNLVPIRKKNGDLRLCVDFRNLNVASLKDNYMLPNIEAMLQNVIGYELISMMGEFFGYN